MTDKDIIDTTKVWIWPTYASMNKTKEDDFTDVLEWTTAEEEAFLKIIDNCDSGDR